MDRSWKYRRIVVFGVILFCMTMIATALVMGGDSIINRDIVQGAWLMMGGVVGSYVFGAIWDDKIKGSEVLGMNPTSQ